MCHEKDKTENESTREKTKRYFLKGETKSELDNLITKLKIDLKLEKLFKNSNSKNFCDYVNFLKGWSCFTSKFMESTT